jgi:hypothetical protein
MAEDSLRPFIIARILSRIAGAGERRTTALRDVLGIAAPHLDRDAIEEIAPLVPELPHSLYEKWAGLFADSLLERIPRDRIEALCLNTEESNATLLLTYSMFMESERMEKIVADDIKALANLEGCLACPGVPSAADA